LLFGASGGGWYALRQANSFWVYFAMTKPDLVDEVIAKLGLTREQWNLQMRARTYAMTLILKKQAERQRVTDEMLSRKCTL
jgi:hypothetical protein